MNIANAFGGSYATKRLWELMEPKKHDDRTAEEIVADIAERGGLTLV